MQRLLNGVDQYRWQSGDFSVVSPIFTSIDDAHKWLKKRTGIDYRTAVHELSMAPKKPTIKVRGHKRN